MSSREGIAESDPLYREFLNELTPQIRKLYDQWGQLRRRDGRPDGTTKSPKVTPKTAAKVIVDDVLAAIAPDLGDLGPEWTALLNRAQAGAELAGLHYVKIYVFENLIREVLADISIDIETLLNKKIRDKVQEYKESDQKWATELGIATSSVRRNTSTLSYLGFGQLLSCSLNATGSHERFFDAFERHSKVVTALRNAVMHTCDLNAPARRALDERLQDLEEALRASYS